MAWKTTSTSYTASDHEFSVTVSASTGKSIKAGGYWISSDINTEIWTRVNGPITDVNGVGGGWTAQGYVPSPPAGGWTVVVYAYEE